MTGQCPKCETSISYTDGEHVDIHSGGTKWHGVSFVCPSCRVVLGIQIDPIAMKADIVSELTPQIQIWSSK